MGLNDGRLCESQSPEAETLRELKYSFDISNYNFSKHFKGEHIDLFQHFKRIFTGSSPQLKDKETLTISDILKSIEQGALI